MVPTSPISQYPLTLVLAIVLANETSADKTMSTSQTSACALGLSSWDAAAVAARADHHTCERGHRGLSSPRGVPR